MEDTLDSGSSVSNDVRVQVSSDVPRVVAQLEESWSPKPVVEGSSPSHLAMRVGVIGNTWDFGSHIMDSSSIPSAKRISIKVSILASEASCTRSNRVSAASQRSQVWFKTAVCKTV